MGMNSKCRFSGCKFCNTQIKAVRTESQLQRVGLESINNKKYYNERDLQELGHKEYIRHIHRCLEAIRTHNLGWRSTDTKGHWGTTGVEDAAYEYAMSMHRKEDIHILLYSLERVINVGLFYRPVHDDL